MNSVERISRLQTLLSRVQKRAKEARVPAPAAADARPIVTAAAAPPAAVAPAAPVDLAPPVEKAAAQPKITLPEPEIRAAAVFVPAAAPVAVDTTLPFSARVAPEILARAGMKSPLGSEPPAAPVEPLSSRTEPAPAPAPERASAPPEIEVAGAEETISEAPPLVVEVAKEEAKPEAARSVAMSELDFADLESPEPLEAEKPEEGEEEAPPASSKRPSLHVRAPEPELERPVTAPPESGPQEVSAAELSTAAKAEPLEVDMALKQARVPREATIEQLGNTVELEAATEEALELAPTEAPAIRKAEATGEMEAEIPASVPPGVYGPDLAHLKVEPAEKPAAEKELELEEIGPVSERMPPVSGEKPVIVASSPESKPEPEREPITAVRLIVPAAKAEPVPVTIEVRPVSAPGAVLEAEAAAFVGATRSFEPGSFLDLLDASLSLTHRS